MADPSHFIPIAGAQNARICVPLFLTNCFCEYGILGSIYSTGRKASGVFKTTPVDEAVVCVPNAALDETSLFKCVYGHALPQVEWSPLGSALYDVGAVGDMSLVVARECNSALGAAEKALGSHDKAPALLVLSSRAAGISSIIFPESLISPVSQNQSGFVENEFTIDLFAVDARFIVQVTKFHIIFLVERTLKLIFKISLADLRVDDCITHAIGDVFISSDNTPFVYVVFSSGHTISMLMIPLSIISPTGPKPTNFSKYMLHQDMSNPISALAFGSYGPRDSRDILLTDHTGSISMQNCLIACSVWDSSKISLIGLNADGKGFITLRTFDSLRGAKLLCFTYQSGLPILVEASSDGFISLHDCCRRECGDSSSGCMNPGCEALTNSFQLDGGISQGIDCILSAELSKLWGSGAFVIYGSEKAHLFIHRSEDSSLIKYWTEISLLLDCCRRDQLILMCNRGRLHDIASQNPNPRSLENEIFLASRFICIERLETLTDCNFVSLRCRRIDSKFRSYVRNARYIHGRIVEYSIAVNRSSDSSEWRKSNFGAFVCTSVDSKDCLLFSVFDFKMDCIIEFSNYFHLLKDIREFNGLFSSQTFVNPIYCFCLPSINSCPYISKEECVLVVCFSPPNDGKALSLPLNIAVIAIIPGKVAQTVFLDVKTIEVPCPVPGRRNLLSTEVKGVPLGHSPYFAVASYGKVFVFMRNKFVQGEVECANELRKSGFGVSFLEVVSSANTVIEVG